MRLHGFGMGRLGTTGHPAGTNRSSTELVLWKTLAVSAWWCGIGGVLAAIFWSSVVAIVLVWVGPTTILLATVILRSNRVGRDPVMAAGSFQSEPEDFLPDSALGTGHGRAPVTPRTP